ncbi:hypothetical protein [Campylobacter upsaliensis]|uniref:Uncharacterized protein n=1 Tax=Campylobacter upsaliensis TaxID=28080 RepID=A0A381EGU6_CAMUP|nr:hypothetical protein [Campylobacter upsaliensis]MCR2101525.1 hypothetical protein [Campylobacter upsaliensis]SUX26186.1 Uncharacterised protein [Campylobacter upsaliensis]
MIITHPKYYTSEGEITKIELIELIENNFHNGHFYENINDFIISIYTNDYNPFTDCDEMPTLLSFSNRYTYGVKELESKEGEIIEINKDNFEDLDDIEAWLIRNDYIFKPFEKYEHSSLHFTLLNNTCTPLQCRFDSSIGGYLVMKKSDLRKARGVKRLNQKLLDDEFKLWQSLLKDFTNYINGWSYELRIENQLKGTLDYFSFTDLEEAVEFALPILNETSEARAS